MRYQSTNEQTQRLSITIYNGGFALVKEQRKLSSTGECTEIQFIDVAKNIEIDSIIVDGIHVLEFNYDHDLVSKHKLLEKYLDQRIAVYDKEQGVKTELRLLSVTDGIIGEKVETKEIVIDPIGELILPSLPNGLIVKPALIWQVPKQTLDQMINVSYLTKGISWNANYVLELMPDSFILTGWVCIDNQSGATFKDAQLKVIAGEVNRIHENRPIFEDDRLYYNVQDMKIEEEFSEKSFADQHMYSLNRNITLKDHQQKQINFLNISKGQYMKYYFVDRYSKQPEIIINIDNNKENQMGIPIPKGKIKVYQADVQDELLEFIGEDRIPHTPKNQLIELTLGKAFDIICENKEKRRYKNRQREYVEYEYHLKNNKEEYAIVKVEHYIPDRNWEIKETTHDFIQEDSQNIVYWVDIEANSHTIISFKYSIENSVDINLKK